MHYIMGIDCGASSSQAVLVPYFFIPTLKAHRDYIRKNIRFTGMIAGDIPRNYPPVNFNVHGFEESAKKIVAIIRSAAKLTGLSNIAAVAAGVSGARFEADRKKLESYIRANTKIRKVRILPDTEIALAAAFEPNKKNCGILIAGTGSILYCRDGKGNVCRIGGWGRLIGDEGSGYWMARTALSHVTKHYDKRGKKTVLSDLIDKHYNLNSSTIVEHIYHNGFALSKIARIVFLAAEKGDRLSKDIIKLAASELAGHFVPIKGRSYEIALMGSLFSEEKLLEKELKKIITSRYKNIKLIKPNLKPVWGAVRIANNIAGEGK